MGSTASICSNTIKNGPYTLPVEDQIIEAPSKLSLEVQRVTITKDVTITMMYRSYWYSYCYNGGSLDPNTGCDEFVKQYLPSYEEATEWINENKCSVGNDCKDCWGSDSRACLEATYASKHWTDGKELEKTSNNNHFACHFF